MVRVTSTLWTFVQSRAWMPAVGAVDVAEADALVRAALTLANQET
jgi:hypothetical protein